MELFCLHPGVEIFFVFFQMIGFYGSLAGNKDRNEALPFLITRSADLFSPIAEPSRYIVSLFTADEISTHRNYLKTVYFSEHARVFLRSICFV